MSKEQKIAFSWLDLYFYLVGAFVCIPYAFLRKNIT